MPFTSQLTVLLHWRELRELPPEQICSRTFSFLMHQLQRYRLLHTLCRLSDASAQSLLHMCTNQYGMGCQNLLRHSLALLWRPSSTCVCLAGTELARGRAKQAVEPAESPRAGTAASRRTPSYPRAGPHRARDQHDDSAADAGVDEADAGETQGQVQEESTETAAQVWWNDDQWAVGSVGHVLCTQYTQVNNHFPRECGFTRCHFHDQPANPGSLRKWPFNWWVIGAKFYRMQWILQNGWTDLRQICREDVFGPSVRRVWMSRSKVTRDKKRYFSAILAICVRFMFGKTPLAPSCIAICPV